MQVNSEAVISEYEVLLSQTNRNLCILNAYVKELEIKIRNLEQENASLKVKLGQ